MVHVAGDQEQRAILAIFQDAGQTFGEAHAARQIAGADGDADDACLRSKPGQERQLHLNGVLTLMGEGVHLQARYRLA